MKEFWMSVMNSTSVHVPTDDRTCKGKGMGFA